MNNSFYRHISCSAAIMTIALLIGHCSDYQSSYFIQRGPSVGSSSGTDLDECTPRLLSCLKQEKCTASVLSKASCVNEVSLNLQNNLPGDQVWEKLLDKKDCRLTGCQNNGACLQKEGAFTCFCPKDYIGETCNILALGSHRDLPGISCQEILSTRDSAHSPSGLYWIGCGQNNGSSFQVYCDMSTDGGGWTLVWGYRFTNYQQFNSSSNAVTPIPNWPLAISNASISYNPPLAEYSIGALNFSLWKEIGSEVLIKSNVNDWLLCLPVYGNLVNWTAGEIFCRNMKNVNSVCNDTVPTVLSLTSAGPAMMLTAANSYYYYFEGSKSKEWPVHDPCGTGFPNQNKGVINPGGDMFIR